MAATWTVFQKRLETIFKLRLVQNFDQFADEFTTAFSTSTLGLAATPFGNTLVSGNYPLIRFGIKTFLDFNFNANIILPKIEASLQSLESLTNEEAVIYELIIITSTSERRNVFIGVPVETKTNTLGSGESENVLALPTGLHPILKQILAPYISEFNKKLKKLNPEIQQTVLDLQASLQKLQDFIRSIDLSKIAYLFLESVFLIFWLTAQYIPFPPAPPTVAPLIGVTTLVPGIPGILSAGFKIGFTCRESGKAAELITQTIQAHAKTITGTYSGLIVTPTGTIPSPPIPWIGIL
jgi:hypothetical protein